MADIVSIIKYEGDNNTFIWKSPIEDFNSMSQLIVHENQEAIFFKDGQALDTFGAGRYTLETGNIPKLGKILNRNTDGDSVFYCEVYFINLTVQMAIKWGTDSKVRYIEPTYGVPLQLGASGEMNLQVSNGRKLLLKLVGTTSGIAWDDNRDNNFTKSLQNCFRPLISTAVKTNLTTAIKNKNINILEVDEHLSEIADEVHKSILPGFEEYGLTIPQFYLTTVVLPEEDSNFKRIKELYTIALQKRMIEAETDIRTSKAKSEAEITASNREVELEKQTTQTEIARREAERKMIQAQLEAEALKVQGYAEAEVMKAKGYNQKDVLQADVQKAYAAGIGNMGGNGGSSTMSDIIGLGIGLQAAGAVGNQVQGLFAGINNHSQANTNNTKKCNSCGATLPENAKFCLECGEKVVSEDNNTITCPKCGKKVIKGKFCPECGYKFVGVCPNCGKEVVTGAKFCLECGEKLYDEK